MPETTANPHPETIMQDELPRLTRAAREEAGMTQAAAAEALGVNQSGISKAENDASGRYLGLQRRMIEELAGWTLHGPLWEVTK